MSKMRLSVHGSRRLADERVKIILLEEIQKYKVTEIITHGEPEGVCEVARSICKENAIPLTLHFLNFRYLRGAFEHRSIAVLENANRAIFIHDGKSKGTANEKALAEKKKIPFSYYQLNPTDFRISVGFNEDWQSVLEFEDIELDLKDIKA